MTDDPSMSEALEVRVPAKAILAGEHFVLYGVRAVAAPVQARALSLRLALREGEAFVLPEPYSGCVEAVNAVLEGQVRGFVRIWATSDIPMGAGLGSSAAFAVAMGRALVSFAARDFANGSTRIGSLEKPALERKAMEIARLLEESIHGSASGIDTAAVAASGAIGYSMTDSVVEKLKVKRDFSFLLVDTGERRTTRSQIEVVAEQRILDPALFRGRSEEAALQVEELVQGLAHGSQNRIFDSVEKLGGILGSLGLESPETTRLRRRMLSKGLALKITGAGGGGFLLGMAADEEAHQRALCDAELSGRVLDFSVPEYKGLPDRAIGG